MLHRLRQFYRALTASIKEEENLFVQKVLTFSERQLFYAMSIVDQRHALDVFYKVMDTMVKKGFSKDSGEMKLLIKAALLHDIGKEASDLSLIDRVLIVIFDWLWPTGIKRLALCGKGGFIQNRRHAFYIAINHGNIGAQKLHKIGCQREVIDLVEKHHYSDSKDWRILILKEADCSA